MLYRCQETGRMNRGYRLLNTLNSCCQLIAHVSTNLNSQRLRTWTQSTYNVQHNHRVYHGVKHKCLNFFSHQFVILCALLPCYFDKLILVRKTIRITFYVNSEVYQILQQMRSMNNEQMVVFTNQTIQPYNGKIQMLVAARRN